MRAIVCSTLCDSNSNLTLEEVSSLSLQERTESVKIAVHAAGVNFADSLIIRGSYQVKPTLPFIPGFEVAGIVTEIKATSPHCKVGDRVMAIVDTGGFAEECIARISDVFILPDNLNFTQAAGLPIAYGTACYGLKVRAKIQHGEFLVVHGAAGGTGLAAVECARSLGAVVTAISSSAEKLNTIYERGAHYLINYKTEVIKAKVKAFTNGLGADVIYDPVGGQMLEESLHYIAPNGRLLIVGFASGLIPKIPANILMVKNITCIGFNFNSCRILDPGGVRSSLLEVLSWYATKHLSPPYVHHIFPLEEASHAVKAVAESSTIGKVVLVVV